MMDIELPYGVIYILKRVLALIFQIKVPNSHSIKKL